MDGLVTNMTPPPLGPVCVTFNLYRARDAPLPPPPCSDWPVRPFGALIAEADRVYQTVFAWVIIWPGKCSPLPERMLLSERVGDGRGSGGVEGCGGEGGEKAPVSSYNG